MNNLLELCGYIYIYTHIQYIFRKVHLNLTILYSCQCKIWYTAQKILNVVTILLTSYTKCPVLLEITQNILSTLHVTSASQTPPILFIYSEFQPTEEHNCFLHSFFFHVSSITVRSSHCSHLTVFASLLTSFN